MNSKASISFDTLLTATGKRAIELVFAMDYNSYFFYFECQPTCVLQLSGERKHVESLVTKERLQFWYLNLLFRSHWLHLQSVHSMDLTFFGSFLQFYFILDIN